MYIENDKKDLELTNEGASELIKILEEISNEIKDIPNIKDKDKESDTKPKK